MKKLLSTLFLSLLLILMLAACSDSEEATGSDDSSQNDSGEEVETEEQTESDASNEGELDYSDLLFTFANATEAGPLFVELGNGIREAAETAGINIKFYDNDLDEFETINNANLMVQENPDLIIEYNPVIGIGPKLEEIFTEAGIPYIANNVHVPGGHWFNHSNPKLGQDTAQVFIEEAKARGWTADNITVIIAQDATSGDDVNASPRHFYATVAKELGLTEVEADEITATTTTVGEHLIQVDGKSTLEDTYTAVKNVLQTIPEDRNIMLFAINDDSSLGGWRAIEEAGRQENTLVAGLGGSQDAIKQLRENPQWIAEADLFFSKWGQYLIAMGVAILNGAETPDVTPAPQAVVTKDNIDEYYPDGATTPQVLPPLVEDNMYLKDTGILQLFGNIQGLE